MITLELGQVGQDGAREAAQVRGGGREAGAVAGQGDEGGGEG
jgi:hypothetical protein